MPTRLIDELIRRTALVEGHRAAIAAQHSQKGGCIDTVILELNLVREAELMPALGAAYGFATAEPADTTRGIEASIFRRFPEQLAVKHGWAPLAFNHDKTTLKVLCTAPPNLKALREVGQILDLKLKPVLTTEIRVQQRQALLYERTPETRFLNLLNTGGGLGTEAIHAPCEENYQNRSSLLPSQPLTFGEATRQLLEAQTRDEVVNIALIYAHRSFSYVALLAARQSKLYGWQAIGPAHERIEDLEIDPSVPSSFAMSLETNAQILGPPKKEDLGYLETMGRNNTRALLLVPMRTGERPFGMFYADNGSAAVSPHLAAEMMVFAHHVQQAMQRILLQQKDAHTTAEVDVLPIPPLAEEAPNTPHTPQTKHPPSPNPLGKEEKVQDAAESLFQAAAVLQDTEKETLKEVTEEQSTSTMPAETRATTPDSVFSAVCEHPINNTNDDPSQISDEPLCTVRENSDAAWEAELNTILKEEEEEEDHEDALGPSRSQLQSQSNLPPFKLCGFSSGISDSSVSPPPPQPDSTEAFPTGLIPPRNENETPNRSRRRQLTTSPLLQAAPPIGFTPKTLRSDDGHREVRHELTNPSTPDKHRPKSFLEDLDQPQNNAFTEEPASFPELNTGAVVERLEEEQNKIETGTFLPTPKPTATESVSTAIMESAAGEVSSPAQTLTVTSPNDPVDRDDENLVTNEEEDPEAIAVPAAEPPPEPAQAPSAEEIETWMQALNSDDLLTRTQACASPTAKSESVLPLLKNKFPGFLDVDPKTPGMALPQFEKCGSLLKVLAGFGAAAHPYVESFIDSPQMKERFFATYFYGQCLVPSIIPQLVRRLHDGDPRISAAAESSLKEYRHEPAFRMVIQHLHTRLHSSSIAAKKRAIACLCTFRDSTAIEPLIKIIEHNEKQCIPLAIVALEEITRQSWGLNCKKWYGWWHKNQNRSRANWLVDALESKDLNTREKAITELAELYRETLEFCAGGSRRQRKKAITSWRRWLKEKKDQ